MTTLPPDNPSDDAVCSVCGRPIAPAESTGRRGDRVLHLACWITERENTRRTPTGATGEPREVLIIARWQSGLYELIRRCATPDFDIRLDQREGERRRPPVNRLGDDRRRHERRAPDAVEHLRRFGWAVVSGAERSA